MANLMPQLIQRFVDGAGEPLVGGKLYTYEAGTSTPLATYQDQDESTLNSNPVVFDSNGEANIWLKDQAYKLVLTDADDNILATRDDVAHIPVGSISSADIADGAITAIKIGSLAVTTAKIDNEAVTTQKLAPGSVTKDKLKVDIINSFETVTPLAEDFIAISDTSDTGKNKKSTIAAIRNAVYRSVTTTDSVGADDETMVLSGNSFTSTLPTAVGKLGKRYKIIHGGDSIDDVYTIDTVSGQTVAGVAGGSYKLYYKGEILEVESDDANWIRVVESAWVPTFEFDTAGSYSLVVPPGATHADFDACGGGGGGGACHTISGDGGGGGAGAIVKRRVVPVVVGETITIVIADGGDGGTGNGVNGSAGGNTTISGSFGTLTFYGANGGTAAANPGGGAGGSANTFSELRSEFSGGAGQTGTGVGSDGADSPYADGGGGGSPGGTAAGGGGGGAGMRPGGNGGSALGATVTAGSRGSGGGGGAFDDNNHGLGAGQGARGGEGYALATFRRVS